MTDNFWKGEVKQCSKDVGLKPTKNSRDMLTKYMDAMLAKMQDQGDKIIAENPSLMGKTRI